MKYSLQLFLVKDQQVVKAFLSDTSHETFADCIGSWSVIRRFENLYSTRCSYTSETRPTCAIVVTNQVHRRLPVGCGYPKLLRHPHIGRGSGYADMNHPPYLEFDDEEGKEGAKAEIAHLQEVAGPDLCCVIA